MIAFGYPLPNTTREKFENLMCYILSIDNRKMLFCLKTLSLLKFFKEDAPSY